VICYGCLIPKGESSFIVTQATPCPACGTAMVRYEDLGAARSRSGQEDGTS